MKKQKLFEKLLKLSQNTEKNVLLLTHIDMDAAGAAILVKLLYPNADIKYCGNATMSRDIKYHVTNDEIADKYDYIFVCDISLTETDADEVNKCKNRNKLVVLDHHASSSHLNEYDWAVCQVELIEDSYRKEKYYGDKEGNSSGVSVMFDYLEYNHMFDNFPENKLSFIKALVHYIAIYDTWDWNFVFNQCTAAHDLDRLSEIYDVELFVDKFVERINAGNYVFFDDIDKLFLSVEQKKIDAHRERVQKSFELRSLYHDGKYYDIVYSYGGEYIQETFELMKELYPDLDLYIINYGGGISLRGVKDDINIGAFVKKFGGGGHKGAGGYKIPYDMLERHMSEILNGTLYTVEAE